MMLRNPQIYSELVAKLKLQSNLLNKARYNSKNLKGDIFDNMDTAHDIGLPYNNNFVEEILENEEYINKKSSSLQNMEFEMMNTLLNKNIMVAKDYFKDDDKEIEEEINERSIESCTYLTSNKSRLSYSNVKKEKKRKGELKFKYPVRGKKKEKELSTRVQSILDEELSFFESEFNAGN